MNTELEKCKNSPYYFVTNYLYIKTAEGLKKFTTRLTEKEFNDIVQGNVQLHKSRSRSK